MKEAEFYQPSNYVNRELSWIDFNGRVLEEAVAPENPLLERANFLGITQSNVDEFFMVRVASLHKLSAFNVTTTDASGMTPKEQLAAVNDKEHQMVEKRYQVYNEQLLPALAKQEIFIKHVTDLNEAEYDFVGAARTVDLQSGLLVDIGGGSTELVFYKDMEIQNAVSLPIGSLSMYTRFIKHLFPTKKERKAIENCVEDMLYRYEVSNLGDCPSVCGVGGTIRAMDKLNSYFCNLSVNNRFVTSENLRSMVKRLENREDKKFIPLETLEILLKVVPERVRTIMPGMIILNTIVKHFKVQNIYVSRAGVREGFLYKQILSKEDETVNG